MGFVLSSGSYNRISIKLTAKASIKGCVAAEMRHYGTSFFNTGTRSALYSDSQNYCTKQALSMWNWESSDDIYDRIQAFKVAGAEAMDFKIGYASEFGKTGEFSTEDLELTYELPETIEVVNGEATQLEFVWI